MHKLIEFNIKNYPYYIKTETKNNIIFCTNSLISLSDVNLAYVTKKTLNDETIENYFKQINRPAAVFSTNKGSMNIANILENSGYILKNPAELETWLIAKNIKKLRKRYSKIKIPESYILEKVTEDNFKEYVEVSNTGFGEESSDNPYGGTYDDREYSNTAGYKLKNQTEDTFRIFIIRHTKKAIGAIELSVSGNMAYVSGAVFLPEYRRTKAAVMFIKILDYLIECNVKTVFCITITGGYPEKFYLNAGFKQIFYSRVYVKQ